MYFLLVILRYNILNPKCTKGYEEDHKGATLQLLAEVNLEAEKYRLGHTKACSLFTLLSPISSASQNSDGAAFAIE